MHSCVPNVRKNGILKIIIRTIKIPQKAFLVQITTKHSTCQYFYIPYSKKVAVKTLVNKDYRKLDKKL